MSKAHFRPRQVHVGLTPLEPPYIRQSWQRRLAGGLGLFLAFVAVFTVGIIVGQVIMAVALR